MFILTLNIVTSTIVYSFRLALKSVKHYLWVTYLIFYTKSDKIIMQNSSVATWYFCRSEKTFENAALSIYRQKSFFTRWKNKSIQGPSGSSSSSGGRGRGKHHPASKGSASHSATPTYRYQRSQVDYDYSVYNIIALFILSKW